MCFSILSIPRPGSGARTTPSTPQKEDPAGNPSPRLDRCVRVLASTVTAQPPHSAANSTARADVPIITYMVLQASDILIIFSISLLRSLPLLHKRYFLTPSNVSQPHRRTHHELFSPPSCSHVYVLSTWIQQERLVQPDTRAFIHAKVRSNTTLSDTRTIGRFSPASNNHTPTCHSDIT